MPRDLTADQKTLDDMPPLSKEPPLPDSPDAHHSMPSLYQKPSSFVQDSFKRLTELHPFSSLLNQDDLDDCDWLEHVAFDENEAASREKVSVALLPSYFSNRYRNVPASTLRLLIVRHCLEYLLHQRRFAKPFDRVLTCFLHSRLHSSYFLPLPPYKR